MTRLSGMLHWHPGHVADRDRLRGMFAAEAGPAASSLLADGRLWLAATSEDAAPRRYGNVVLAFAGDLLNRDELRDRSERGELQAAVARLYERQGPDGVRALRGAFALALWDEELERLVLAGDHLGLARLYYSVTPSGVAFASRASSVVAAPGVVARVDRLAVYEYLNFGYVPSPRTIWTGVYRLPPGHLLVAQRGAVACRPYWDLEYQERRAGLGAAARATAEAVEAAVGAALAGARPKDTGAFLSGGTDSSTVVGLMAKLTGERVNAFSIGFREPRYDELSYAALAARHFKAAHYARIVTADEAFEAMPELVETYDEPFGNNSAIGTLFCARLARETGVTCLLAGDGGDEIFGGNERYRTDRIFALWQRVPALLRTGVLEPALRGLGERGPGPLRRIQRYARRAAIPNPRRFYSYEFFFAQEGQPLLDPDFLVAAGADTPWQAVEAHFARARAASELNRLLYLDLKLTIGDSDLPKVTRTAERAGVLVRFPLLHLPLVEWTAALPARFKVRGFEKRYLFKYAFRPLLPREILAKRKHGFGVPTGLWLRSHPRFEALARDALLSPAARQRGYFRPGAIEDLLARHAAEPTPYYGDLLWTVLLLELWHRRHGAAASR
jgi:asparagine synthase (glutamine-hydrolysing)